MISSACVDRVRDALAAVATIKDPIVDLASARVMITVPRDWADAGRLFDALRRQGYATPTTTFDVMIEGMTCASCVARVEATVRLVPGVIAVSVNLATARARITALAAVDVVPLLAAAVVVAGYGLSARSPAPSAASAPSVKISQDTFALLLAHALTLPLMSSMALDRLGYGVLLPPVAQLLLATIVQVVAGAEFYRAAWRGMRAGVGNMDLLVSTGTTAAWGLSVYLLANAPGDQSLHLYFDVAAMVIAFVLLGRRLEARAKFAAGDAIHRLANLRPAIARIRMSGTETEVPIDYVAVGDEVVIRPGERIPADGIVVEGAGDVDESMLTGESPSVAKRPGQVVSGGTVNGAGALIIRVTAIDAESRLTRITDMISSAQASRAPIQRMADRIGAWFVPAALVAAGLTFAFWLLVAGDLEQAAIHSVAVLVVACPCALGLATPAAIAVATGAAARTGILIRDADTLERAAAVDLVLLKRTGILTEGIMQLVAIEPANDGQRTLRLAVGLQAFGNHPIARALRDAAHAAGEPFIEVRDFKTIPGRGVEGIVDGLRLLMGDRRLMMERGLDVQALDALASGLEAKGQIVTWLAEVGPVPRTLAVLGFADKLKPTGAQAIAKLRGLNVRAEMVTGASDAFAAITAATLELDAAHAEATPEMRISLVRSQRASGHVVAMAGDGVNDAAALAAADVGMAMATGADAATEAAAIMLLHGEPLLIPAAIEICRRTMAKIRQNLLGAAVYNVMGILLAASGLLNPMFAGAAMSLSSVIVIANALQLRRWRPAAGW